MNEHKLTPTNATMKHTLLPSILAIASTGLFGCATAQVFPCHEITTVVTSKPAFVYVAEFNIDAANIKTDPAAPPPPPKLPGLLGKALPPPPGAPRDPQTLVRDLVDSMSKSLVKELTQTGLDARRLAPGEAIPNSGWLVRG